MLGQPASSQTVCRPSRRTSDFSSVYSGPVFSLVLIHGGLRSIGVSALRTSRRRSFRPSGATVTLPAYVSRLGGRSGGGSADEPEAPDGPGAVRQHPADRPAEPPGHLVGGVRHVGRDRTASASPAYAIASSVARCRGVSASHTGSPTTSTGLRLSPNFRYVVSVAGSPTASAPAA